MTSSTTQTSIDRPRVRVPDPTPMFWIAKAVSTALGEAVSDFSIHVMPPVTAVLVGFALFVIALIVQLTRRRYIPGFYWAAVAMVGVFGTMAADVVHVAFGVPYVVSSALYAVALALVFVVWWLTERTLSVHEITTTRRELFYWAAVVATFAMGTALGDLAAVGLGLGYLPAIVIFTLLLTVPALGYRFLHWNGVFAFWFAYVLTRPLGASVADWLGKPVAEGGLGVGAGWVSLVLALVMIALVVLMSVRPKLSGGLDTVSATSRYGNG